MAFMRGFVICKHGLQQSWKQYWSASRNRQEVPEQAVPGRENLDQKSQEVLQLLPAVM